MLDPDVVGEFLYARFEEMELKVPDDIPKEVLIETFCRYVEDDYYEWLKDNFKSFFDHGDADWQRIRGHIKHYSGEWPYF